jgi:NhaA family Na+:H+ antiporter
VKSRAREQLLLPFREFFRLESASGLVLLGCVASALIIANTGASDAYFRLLRREAGFHLGPLELRLSLLHWINDGLMTLFFLVVGLEIKRELVTGELRHARQAAMPAIAALGGMAAPALIYAAFNHGTEAGRGWGIPVATDIAFALGILSLAGKRAPPGLKIFLAALAIIDDLGAVLVIAIFYTGDLHWGSLACAGAVYALLIACNRMGVRFLAAYMIPGVALWYFISRSGVHGTVAGVLLAFALPTGSRPSTSPQAEAAAPLPKLEAWLHPWTGFFILPLFALANAGIRFDSSLLGSLAEPVSLGVIFGLAAGKPLGIFLSTWAALRLRLAALPGGVGLAHILGAGLLGGIGFTMSIFITGLAFGGEGLAATAKTGIFIASGVSGLAGLVYLRCRPDTTFPASIISSH